VANRLSIKKGGENAVKEVQQEILWS